MTKRPTQKGTWIANVLKTLKPTPPETLTVEREPRGEEKQGKVAGGMQQDLQDMGRMSIPVMRNEYTH